MKRNWSFYAGVFGSFVVLVFISNCSKDISGRTGPPPVSVTVASVIQKDVPLQLRIIGTVEAYSTVSVKSKVGGELVTVHFKEGQDVKKGELLFTIDPRSYEAALQQVEANLARDVAQVKQSEANLERDMAQARNAEEEAKRYEFLMEKKVVAKQQYDQFRTNAEALQAAVRADRAAVENTGAAVRADEAALKNAKIQLGYCFIHSPMDGRTGNLLVKQGNHVKAEDINLVVINQVNPIYVTFSVPEQNLSGIRKLMAAGKLKVEAIILNNEKPCEGILTFVDNAVDTTTGTIQLKGTFDNREKRLWPGQFVRVVLTLTTQRGALVVPSQAIQDGQEGRYVFVVKPDLTVESRSVTIRQSLAGETVVEKGVQPGETVVTDGQLQLVPKAKVEIKNRSAGTEKNP
jgi:multidrug efflux system membrane fusion protein